jgi:hypothetical protein
MTASGANRRLGNGAGWQNRDFTIRRQFVRPDVIEIGRSEAEAFFR